MNQDLVHQHYNDPKVQNEIVRFSQNRWVGLHCSEMDKRGRPYLIRYLGRGKQPLILREAEDIQKFLRIFNKLGPRTFYATANVYRELSRFEHLTDLSNIEACTPTWDIDNVPEKWQASIKATQEIISFLEQNGIKQSAYVVWSGRGCHVRIHEGAISIGVRKKINPLDVAYAIVEYVNAKLTAKFTDIALEHNAENLRVDNEIDPQRLFTCPLSLHKELDRVCVCIAPDSLNQFTPDWTLPKTYKHYGAWDRHSIGEADELAVKAFQTVGGCPSLPRFRARKHPPLDEQIMKWLDKIRD